MGRGKRVMGRMWQSSWKVQMEEEVVVAVGSLEPLGWKALEGMWKMEKTLTKPIDSPTVPIPPPSLPLLPPPTPIPSPTARKR